MIAPHLPSCWGFSFALGYGFVFFVVFLFFVFLVGYNILLSMVVQLLVDFGVLAGEDEHTFFYSIILT